VDQWKDTLEHGEPGAWHSSVAGTGWQAFSDRGHWQQTYGLKGSVPPFLWHPPASLRNPSSLSCHSLNTIRPPTPPHAGGAFKLSEYCVLPNPMRMASAVTLLDILDCMSFVRTHLRGEQQKIVIFATI
jgi:hypothetical protein